MIKQKQIKLSHEMSPRCTKLVPERVCLSPVLLHSRLGFGKPLKGDLLSFCRVAFKSLFFSWDLFFQIWKGSPSLILPNFSPSFCGLCHPDTKSPKVFPQTVACYSGYFMLWGVWLFQCNIEFITLSTLLKNEHHKNLNYIPLWNIFCLSVFQRLLRILVYADYLGSNPYNRKVLRKPI